MLTDGSFTGSLVVEVNGQSLIVTDYAGPADTDVLYSDEVCVTEVTLPDSITDDTTYYWKRDQTPTTGSAIKRGTVTVTLSDDTALGDYTVYCDEGRITTIAPMLTEIQVVTALNTLAAAVAAL